MVVGGDSIEVGGKRKRIPILASVGVEGGLRIVRYPLPGVVSRGKRLGIEGSRDTDALPIVKKELWN
jgi:hypothetical protein